MSPVTMPTTDPSTTADPQGSALRVGASIEVHNDFNGRWVPGFAIAETGGHRCRIRRTSDSAVLPVWFDTDDVRVSAR